MSILAPRVQRNARQRAGGEGSQLWPGFSVNGEKEVVSPVVSPSQPWLRNPSGKSVSFSTSRVGGFTTHSPPGQSKPPRSVPSWVVSAGDRLFLQKCPVLRGLLDRRSLPRAAGGVCALGSGWLLGDRGSIPQPGCGFPVLGAKSQGKED